MTTAVIVSPRATPRTRDREPRRSDAPPGPHQAMSTPAANPTVTAGAMAGPAVAEVRAEMPSVAQNVADTATRIGTKARPG